MFRINYKILYIVLSFFSSLFFDFCYFRFIFVTSVIDLVDLKEEKDIDDVDIETEDDGDDDDGDDDDDDDGLYDD